MVNIQVQRAASLIGSNEYTKKTKPATCDLEPGTCDLIPKLWNCGIVELSKAV